MGHLEASVIEGILLGPQHPPTTAPNARYMGRYGELDLWVISPGGDSGLRVYARDHIGWGSDIPGWRKEAEARWDAWSRDRS